MSTAPIDVVGIGADGWDGLSPRAQRVVHAAEVVMGSCRQLDLLPDTNACRVPWPSPLLPALPELLDEHADAQVCVLASGDPMFHGIGSTLTRLVGPGRLRVLPHPSSASLACARLGWPLHEVEVLSAVGKPVAALHPSIHDGRRILVLSADETTPAAVASLLVSRGYGGSRVSVLDHLGDSTESVTTRTAREWGSREATPLNVIAVECRADADARVLARTPGLPDDAFDHDGQLTKRTIRAVTVSTLEPTPGALLWDVGAGTGSIAIEWMRTHPACRATAIEHREDRAARIARNADELGVPGLHVVTGAAPGSLHGLDRPDAVFVGGGVTTEGLFDACWQALRPGGRIVVNAVTVESEAVLAELRARHGGDMLRLAVDHARSVGGFTGWQRQMPVTQWTTRKSHEEGI